MLGGGSTIPLGVFFVIESEDMAAWVGFGLVFCFGLEFLSVFLFFLGRMFFFIFISLYSLPLPRYFTLASTVIYQQQSMTTKQSSLKATWIVIRGSQPFAVISR
jgi:hypothetical protein